MPPRRVWPPKPKPSPQKLEPDRSLQFAITFDMLTDEEVAAIKNGNAALALRGKALTPMNMDGYTNGSHYKLYVNRKFDVLARQLLGLNQEQ